MKNALCLALKILFIKKDRLLSFINATTHKVSIFKIQDDEKEKEHSS